MIQILISMMMTIPKIPTMITRAYVFSPHFGVLFHPLIQMFHDGRSLLPTRFVLVELKYFQLCFCVKIINYKRFLAIMLTKDPFSKLHSYTNHLQ